MLEALGGSLSAALGIAISPVPIIATILMLLALAWREFRHRAEGGMPGWMSAIDSMSVGKALTYAG